MPDEGQIQYLIKNQQFKNSNSKMILLAHLETAKKNSSWPIALHIVNQKVYNPTGVILTEKQNIAVELTLSASMKGN